MANLSLKFDKYTWSSYSSMIRRTQFDGRGDYLGMEVEPVWLFSFEEFVKDVGIRPKGSSLDRIDPTKGYIRGNCRWASRSTQARNKRNTLKVNYAGDEWVLIDLCEHLGVDYELVRGRLKVGLDLDTAISQEKRHSWTKLTINGVEFTLRGYCESLGVDYQLVRDRLRFGWELEDAVALPKGSRNPKNIRGRDYE